MATPNSTDYKALVYVFLYGGNQSYNMIVPYSQDKYDQYKRARSNLALPRTAVTGANILEPFQTVYSGSNTIAVTGASGNGATATITFARPAVLFPIGHSINISGVIPGGYNGNYTVTASTSTATSSSVSVASTATATYVGGGTITYSSLMPGLVQLNGTASDTKQYGMHPECTELASIFNDGKAAILCNIGTLGEPTTLSQYQNLSVELPSQLFSHYDQTIQWMIGTSGSTVGYGWGGKVADFYKQNAYTSELDMNLFTTTQNLFGSGQTTNAYAIGLGIPPDSYASRIQSYYLSGSRSTINNTLKLMSMTDSNPLVKGYAEIRDSFVTKTNILNRTIAGTGNLLKSNSNWIAGGTAPGGYNALGGGDDVRLSVTDPFGNAGVAWETRATLNPTSTVTVDGVSRIALSSDGGIDTAIFPADPKKKYRFTHWMKRTGNPDVFDITGSIITDQGRKVLIVETMPTGKYVMQKQYVFIGTTYYGTIEDAGTQWGITDNASNKFRISTTQTTTYPTGTTITIKSSGGQTYVGPGPAGNESTILNINTGGQNQYPYWDVDTVYHPNWSGQYPAHYSMILDRWYLSVNILQPYTLVAKDKGTVANLSLLPSSGALIGDTYTVTSTGTWWVYVGAPTTNDDNTTVTNNGFSYRGFTKNGIHPESGWYKRLTDGSIEKVVGPGVTLFSVGLTGGLAQDGLNNIAVADTTKFSSTGGIVQIDNEVIYYSGKSVATGPGNLTGLTRNVTDTGQVAHNSSAIVYAKYEVAYNSNSAGIKMSEGTTSLQYRIYNFYNQEGVTGSPGTYFTKFQIYKPRVDLVDGNEPSLATLALNGGTSSSEIVTNFDATYDYGGIGPQLSQVFGVIKSAAALTTLQDHRQIFFVNMFGFDNHDGEGQDHPKLMRSLSKNVKAFYDALNTAGLSNKVTISIQSEFARTLAANGTGDGSDHAWGGYAMVLGGGVTGGFYGTPPEISLGSANVNTIGGLSITSASITDTIGTITYTAAKSLKAGDYVTINGVSGSWSGTGSITNFAAPTTYKVLSYISATSVRLVTVDGAALATTAGTILGTISATNPNPLDVDGAGRLIPTLSTEQQAATLAKWFGVDSLDLPTLFPNLSKFSPTTLGFLP